MRILVGRVVDVDADVNLADLSPLDRIIASATNAYRNTGLYKRRYAESEERRQEQLRKVRESLTDNLLSVITPNLVENKMLKSKGDECRGLLLEVPYRFNYCLAEVVSTHEFDAYDITIIPPSKMLSKFAKPPSLLYVKYKGG